jgi:NYN domain
MRTNVYVDGFNLYYGCLKGTPYRWLDLRALCRLLLPRNTIGRIRYFTARIQARNNDQHGPVHQAAYLRALATLPEVSIHLGQFKTGPVRMPLAHPLPGGPATVEVIKTEEKGSDVNLATYLLSDAFHSDCEVSVVISNDSDLLEPIRVVCHDLGRKIGIINPHPPRKRSRELLAIPPTFYKQIRPSGLARSQFPRTLTDAQGKIHKPANW